MRALSAGLIFVNAATVCAVFVGMAAGGLQPIGAGFSLLVGLICACATWLASSDPAPISGPGHDPVSRRTRYFWTGLVAAVFAIFAARSFCWLYYIDGAEWKIQSPNNLGDLALHITYIKTFMSGVPLWPVNPIYIASKMRYPAGIDLFNALFGLLHWNLEQTVVWFGLLGSIATFYALWRWGGSFAVAGFLFNGGIIGFVFLQKLLAEHTVGFQDYQGASDIAWKSIPLSMFVTQRGWLYAIPVGLLLLWTWRESLFASEPAVVSSASGADSAAPPKIKSPLPLGVQVALYASMPLFHVHTFLALSGVLAFLFVGGNNLIRWRVGAIVVLAFLPATFFVWLVSDNFHAHSMIAWHPGWVRDDHPLGRSSFFDFWFTNFGISLPLVLGLIALWIRRTWKGIEHLKLELVGLFALLTVLLCLWRIWEDGASTSALLWLLAGFVVLGWYLWRGSETAYFSDVAVSSETAFILAAVAIFFTGLLFKFAPWGWDNLKLMVWGYFIILPFLWDEVIRPRSMPLRTGLCIALFGSGFVSLFGGLAAGLDGYGFANRGEVDGVGKAVSILPLNARFVCFPTYNHPLLLQGRRVAMGYPGHLWTQGFDDYGKVEAAVKNVMTGAPNWRATARALGVRYLFWGREEQANYGGSTRPWEAVAPIVAAGDWGTVYDLEALEPNAPRSLGEKKP